MLVNVLLEGVGETILTYSYDTELEVGTIVIVTVRGKPKLGIIWELISQSNLLNILPIAQITHYRLQSKFMNWISKVAEYNCLGLSEVITLALTGVDPSVNLSHYYLYEDQLVSVSHLLSKLGKRKFHKLLHSNEIIPHTSLPDSELTHLNEAQVPVWYQLQAHTKPVVLQGKTGSGKSLLYFHLIKSVIDKGQKALILMPEISLTSTFAERVKAEFGFMPHVWNSKVLDLAKASVWDWSIQDGPGILIGSRSALWLPFANLGLIVIDEEHDSSYKQENSPRYHARDMAVLRTKYEHCKIVLVSATPSLESWFNVQNGKYELASLGGEQPISAKVVQRKKDAWLSEEAKELIEVELAKGNQCMLFLNRKGLARSVFCSICQESIMCDQCSSNLVLYRNFVMGCSYCGKKRYLQTCKGCGGTSWQTYGIGIEKIEEETKTLFPTASIGKFSGEIHKLHDSVEDIYSGKINLIITTQVLSKGYNFLKLSLVVILQGEQGMNSSDPRNTEKIYQLLTQVRGRCGRNKNDSTVLIQSSSAQNELLEHVLQNDYPTWANRELVFRKEAQLPPVYKLIRIMISNVRAISAEADASFLYAFLRNMKHATVFEPIPNQLHKYKARFYYSILIRYHHNHYIQLELTNIIRKNKLPKRSRLVADVDPQGFM